MDHSHHHMHMDHSGTPDTSAAMMDRCDMYMLWNTNIINTCVVFRQWHIHSNLQFFLSCVAVVLIGVGYEWLRDVQKKVDRKIAAHMLLKGKSVVSRRHRLESEGEVAENEPLLIGADTSKAGRRSTVPFASRILRAGLYGATVFVSFFLMLVFMTYNAYLIVATVVGAAIGHYIFQSELDVDAALAGAGSVKGMSCH